MCLAFVLISVVPLPNPCLSFSFGLTGGKSAERNESQQEKREWKRKRRKAAGDKKGRENKWGKGATNQKESTFYSLFRKYFQIVFELQTMLATVIWNSLNLFECIWRIFSHSSPNLCVFYFISLSIWQFCFSSVFTCGVFGARPSPSPGRPPPPSWGCWAPPPWSSPPLTSSLTSTR